MTKKFLKEAVQLCLDNVKQYIKDAKLLVENGSYGHAFALAVLGEEELSKSFIYYMCSEGFLPTDVIKKVGRTRESHMRKQTIAGTLTLTSKIVEFMQSIINLSWEHAPNDLRKRYEIIHGKLKETADNIKKNQDEWRAHIFGFFERVATLEDDKEMGLYVDVDITEKTLKSPKSLDKGKVERQIAQVKETFEFFKPLLTHMFSPSEIERAKTEMAKSGMLRDFINTF